jgi:multidrug efflux system membrane fusion protein
MVAKPAEPVMQPGVHGDPVAARPLEPRPAVIPWVAPQTVPAQAAPRRGILFWIVVVALAGVAWYTRQAWMPWIPSLSKNGPPAKVQKPVPVRTATVVQRDMPLYINGLGTVTAFKTVTLKSRVDGELVKVAFTEGQMVKEGDFLAQIDPRQYQAQLDQCEGTLARDEATLELARLTLARGRELLEKKSIAQQQLDEEAAQVEQLEGTVQTDRGLVDNAKVLLRYSRITAPISGRIGLRLVDQGNIVHANDLLGMAVITQLQPIAVVFPINQDEIPRVQKRTRDGIGLTVLAYDRNFAVKLAEGKLTAIDNQVDATTGTVKLKATFENEDGMLFPNQFVNARLLVDTQYNAMIVPAAAVQRGPKSTFVYVVPPGEEKVELREVIAGPTEGAETSIVTGLSPGEVVVTEGIDKLKDGTSITTRDKEEKSAGDGADGSATTDSGKNEAGSKAAPEKDSQKADAKNRDAETKEAGQKDSP